MERAAAGRSTAIRARPKTSRSRSSSRGPQRAAILAAEPALEPLERARAGRGRRSPDPGRPVTSTATTAFRNSGWSTTPTGSVAYRRDTARSADGGQRRQRANGRDERRLGIADVGAEADVRADSAVGSRLPLRWRLDSGPCARSASESCTRDRARTPGPLERWLAEVRGAGARRHAAGFAAAGASDVEIVSAPPDAIAVRRAASRPSCRAERRRRPRRARLGGGPAGDGRRPAGVRGRGRRPTIGGRSPTIGTRPTSSPSRGPRRSRRSRTCPATTPCRAGSRRSPATASTTSAGAGGSAFDIDGPLDLVLLARTARARRRSMSGG